MIVRVTLDDIDCGGHLSCDCPWARALWASTGYKWIVTPFAAERLDGRQRIRFPGHVTNWIHEWDAHEVGEPTWAELDIITTS